MASDGGCYPPELHPYYTPPAAPEPAPAAAPSDPSSGDSAGAGSLSLSERLKAAADRVAAPQDDGARLRKSVIADRRNLQSVERCKPVDAALEQHPPCFVQAAIQIVVERRRPRFLPPVRRRYNHTGNFSAYRPPGLVRGGPIGSDPGIDHKRDGQLCRVLHRIPHNGLRRLYFCFRHFEQ